VVQLSIRHACGPAVPISAASQHCPTRCVRTSVRPIPGLFTTFEGHAFRQDRQYFSLAERHKSKDTISVYDATNLFRLERVSLTRSLIKCLRWAIITKIKHFRPPTSSKNSLALSPSGNHITVWEGLMEVCHDEGMTSAVHLVSGR
jgi:hypothetical protein